MHYHHRKYSSVHLIPDLKDLELSQLDKVYLNDLGNYNRIINQRNKLLKDISFNSGLKDTLDIWDIQLIEYGKK